MEEQSWGNYFVITNVGGICKGKKKQAFYLFRQNACFFIPTVSAASP